MKKWKVINVITIIIPILFIIRLIIDAIVCMNMKYPHPMLGIDAYNWFDQFKTDFIFLITIWGIPLIIDVIFFIISYKKIKKSRK